MNMESASNFSASILVVDDTPANLRLLTEMLSAQGYQVRVAPTGELALKSVHSHPPDLILLDIRMPGMDGFQVCAELKAHPTAREIPILFLTALEDTSHKLQAFKAGGADYLTKPVEPIEVLKRIQTHLGLRLLQRDFQSCQAECARLEQRLRELEQDRAEK